jgi:predicted nucleic acid-binding Zn ribbon protein
MKDETFDKENFNEEKITINIIWANVFGLIVLLLALVLFGIPFIMLWNNNISLSTINIIVYFVVFIIGIVIHEAIHGFFFVLFSKEKIKSIKFGIMPREKFYTPYCHCKEILSINHYRIAAIMPLIILGIIPVAVSLIYGNILLLLFGVTFISAGCGDLLMILKLIKEKKNAWIYDLPDDAGFIIYRSKN